MAATLEAAAVHARARVAWDSAGDLLEQARALTPSANSEAARRRGVGAAELHMFVSVRTVESHLSRAYAKLGVRSRSQLAGRLSGP